MRGAFDEDDFEPALKRRDRKPQETAQRDTELTLGPLVLTGLVLGLILLCGICFGLGYRMGHRGASTTQAAIAQPAPDAQTTPQVDPSHAKPSATTQAPSATQPPAADQPLSDTDSATSVPVAGDAAGSQPSPAQNAAAGGFKVQPASAPTAPMVHIAAVSHQEDAEVLVNALRKRGYAVSVSHDAADSLLHVRVGPFANLSEADKWRQKLLNDGYNAIVQP